MVTHLTLVGKNINEKNNFVLNYVFSKVFDKDKPILQKHEIQIKLTNINEALMKKTNLIFSNYIFSEANEKDKLVSCYFL